MADAIFIYLIIAVLAIVMLSFLCVCCGCCKNICPDNNFSLPFYNQSNNDINDNNTVNDSGMPTTVNATITPASSPESRPLINTP